MQPYEFQIEAANKTVVELESAYRAKVIMPCGTGKTIVGLSIVETMKPRRCLVMAPSLALIKQLLDTYAAETELPRVIVVCSDDSTAKEAREQFEIPHVTTDVKTIASELKRRSRLIAFCTYQSGPRIAEAFAVSKLPAFDLAVFDEAHHMAGGSKLFTIALKNERIPIRKRVFMTATPRIATKSASKQAEDECFEFASMDDESLFGREAYSMSFNDAIAGDHLTDYQVAVFVVRESEISQWLVDDQDAAETAKRVAMLRAIEQHGIRKVIAYHSSVTKMKWFADIGLPRTLEALYGNDVRSRLWSRSMSASDSASSRKKTLDTFGALDETTVGVLSNCKVLQEGVDCPSVDAVCLSDSRSSPIDIVQIVGRAIRKSKNKTIATIIIPVFMPAGLETDVESFVQSSGFSAVWDVVAALKSHDGRVSGWIESGKAFGQGTGNTIPLSINLPVQIQARFFAAIESRIVGKFSARSFEQLSEDSIWAEMLEYKRINGKFPTDKTKCTCKFGLWKTIGIALFTGSRGLPGGSSLAKLRRRNTGIDTGRKSGISLTEDLVWQEILAFKKANGIFPSTNTKPKTSFGITWSAMSGNLSSGYYGLPGGSSLAKLIEARTGKKRPDNRPLSAIQLTEDMIYERMKAFKSLRGFWPGVNKRHDPTDLGSWPALADALKHGYRGLPGGSSLEQVWKSRENQEFR